MIASPVEPRRWSAGRWWAAIAIVFALQVVMFQLLQDHSPVVPRKTSVAPVFRLSYGGARQWFALEDPTLFALPHYQGFSGVAWLRIPPFEFRPSEWSEPARVLPLSTGELGVGFADFVHTNPAPAFQTVVLREPELAKPEPVVTGPVMVASGVRLEGALAKRRLLSRFALPAFTNSDLVTNSVVQLLVDGRGNTVSAVLLPPGSNLPEANQRALELAREARFEPVPAGPASARDPSMDVTVGKMVFQWETLAQSFTNSPGSATP